VPQPLRGLLLLLLPAAALHHHLLLLLLLLLTRTDRIATHKSQAKSAPIRPIQDRNRGGRKAGRGGGGAGGRDPPRTLAYHLGMMGVGLLRHLVAEDRTGFLFSATATTDWSCELREEEEEEGTRRMFSLSLS
jgi:hypothetical protein